MFKIFIVDSNNMMNNDNMSQEMISTDPHCAFISSNSEPTRKMEKLSESSNIHIYYIIY